MKIFTLILAILIVVIMLVLIPIFRQQANEINVLKTEVNTNTIVEICMMLDSDSMSEYGIHSCEYHLKIEADKADA